MDYFSENVSSSNEENRVGYIDLGEYGIHFGGNLGIKTITITWMNAYS